ncbi:MAG: hypothetical protein RIQ89_870 [Bacteroidota bacterium]|jgi:cell division protein YceG involved in septum cleavage
MRNLRIILLAATIPMVLVFFNLGCKKKGDTKAVVEVRDSLGNFIKGATVTLWQDTSINQQYYTQSNVRVTKTSDQFGKTEFVFQLEAYLNIEAIKSGDTAKGFIRLKEGETVYETVSIR